VCVLAELVVDLFEHLKPLARMVCDAAERDTSGVPPEPVELRRVIF
jgi:hypothetical protein